MPKRGREWKACFRVWRAALGYSVPTLRLCGVIGEGSVEDFMTRRTDQRRVLLVDDSRVTRNLQKATLLAAGYAVVDVDCGEAALAEIGIAEGPPGGGGHGFELVLLDNMMPGLSGPDVLRRIREFYSRVELPVIMVTARDESGDIVNALKAQANDYVIKPIDFPVLLARMETHIGFKKSHEDLRNSHRSLIHAAKMESVAHLAAGVAHEIRKPLAQIQMSVDGAMMALGDEAKMAKEFLGMTIEAVERAEGIISELVNYSSSASLKLAKADLNDFVSETLELMTEEFEGHATLVKRELAAEPPMAFISPEELRQVLLNLLLNSLQAMATGGTVTIRTGVRVVEGLVAVEGARTGARVRNGDEAAFVVVEDNGPGIAEGDLSKVFDPFFTSKATGRDHGKGLGLTVARQLIELHGGAIELENSSPGLRATLLLRVNETAML
jgi:signal transduction histidine kinase